MVLLCENCQHPTICEDLSVGRFSESVVGLNRLQVECLCCKTTVVTGQGSLQYIRVCI
jgi:hypothetical protein